MMSIFLVGFGGFLGSITRYLLGNYVSSLKIHSFPLGTLFVNVTGSFLVGFLATNLDKAAQQQHNYWIIGAIGFIGAYTTFSAFSLETLVLWQEGKIFLSILNIFANTMLGLLAVFFAQKIVI